MLIKESRGAGALERSEEDFRWWGQKDRKNKSK